jgi:acetoin utilization deacetylase AcuC-like enzyme
MWREVQWKNLSVCSRAEPDPQALCINALPLRFASANTTRDTPVKTGFYFDEKCFWHSSGLHTGTLPVGGWVQPPSGSGHAESPESKRRLKNLMDVSGLAAALDVRSAAPVTLDDMLRIHPRRYLSKLKDVSDAGGGMVGDNAPFGPGSYEIAMLSAGLAAAAVDDVLAGRQRNAYALSRPPGHHCLRDQSMGFCFLANIPIAVERARANHGIKRVAIIDWDVHHGNGTQSIYYGDPDTLTISLHQENCFPAGYAGADDMGEGAGAGANINIPLLAGGGDGAYRYAFERIVNPAVQRFKPELIVVASGFDSNALDPLGRMQAHSGTFRTMTGHVLGLASDLCGSRVVIVHEGGYSESYVPFCGHAVIEQLAGVRTAVVDPLLDFITLQQPGARFDQFQCALIDELAAGFKL